MSAGLMERESTGGAVARVGFEYQDAYVLQNLPLWLSQSAFSHMVSEAIGDVEICYFSPTGGFHRVMYEAKNHTLTAPDFWKEIERFKKAFDTSPSEFVRFVLVCRDFNSVTTPLLSKLERLRGVGSSYQPDSVFLSSGRQDIVDWCVKSKFRADLAEFVLDYVDFVIFASEQADSAFAGELAKHLPSLDLTTKQVGRLRDKYKDCINRSSYGPIKRKELDGVICEVLDSDQAHWISTPIKIEILDGLIAYQQLGLNIDEFNGANRARLSADKWQSLYIAAKNVAAFIKDSTLRRCVALDGKQRMSTACLLGSAFSATEGFLLLIDHNGLIYRTNEHNRADGTFFNSTLDTGRTDSVEGVACIGFPTPVGTDLGIVTTVGLNDLSKLILDSTKTINGMEALNIAIAEAKTELVQFRSQHQLSKIHLFVKAPSVFAIVLGHRLNGICQIQLYDWIEGQYFPTIELSQ